MSDPDPRRDDDDPAEAEAREDDSPGYRDGAGTEASPGPAEPEEMATMPTDGLLAGSSGDDALLQPGEHLGQFLIRGKLGAGGMGQVYRAVDEVRGVDVAVKVMHEDSLASDEARQRFRAEADHTMELSHDHIARTHFLGVQGPLYYMVMELLHGESLQERIAVFQEVGRSFEWDEVREMARQIAEGLQYAHDRDLVHRDIKPANVFLVNRSTSAKGDSTKFQDHLKIVDFGIAKSGALQMTQAADVFGTPAYMAPEQLRETRRVDGRADQYSLAKLLVRVLATGHDLEHDVPEELPIPAHAKRALDRALSDDPRKRFPTVREFAEAFRGAESSGGARLPRVAAAVVVLGLAGWGAWEMWGPGGGEADPRSDTTSDPEPGGAPGGTEVAELGGDEGGETAEKDAEEDGEASQVPGEEPREVGAPSDGAPPVVEAQDGSEVDGSGDRIDGEPDGSPPIGTVEAEPKTGPDGRTESAGVGEAGTGDAETGDAGTSTVEDSTDQAATNEPPETTGDPVTGTTVPDTGTPANAETAGGSEPALPPWSPPTPPPYDLVAAVRAADPDEVRAIRQSYDRFSGLLGEELGRVRPGAEESAAIEPAELERRRTRLTELAGRITKEWERQGAEALAAAVETAVDPEDATQAPRFAVLELMLGSQILSPGAFPSFEGLSPLHRAVRTGRPAPVQRVLAAAGEQGRLREELDALTQPPAPQPGRTALQLCVASSPFPLEVARSLIAAGGEALRPQLPALLHGLIGAGPGDPVLDWPGLLSSMTEADPAILRARTPDTWPVAAERRLEPVELAVERRALSAARALIAAGVPLAGVRDSGRSVLGRMVGSESSPGPIPDASLEAWTRELLTAHAEARETLTDLGPIADPSVFEFVPLDPEGRLVISPRAGVVLGALCSSGLLSRADRNDASEGETFLMALARTAAAAGEGAPRCARFARDALQAVPAPSEAAQWLARTDPQGRTPLYVLLQALPTSPLADPVDARELAGVYFDFGADLAVRDASGANVVFRAVEAAKKGMGPELRRWLGGLPSAQARTLLDAETQGGKSAVERAMSLDPKLGNALLDLSEGAPE